VSKKIIATSRPPPIKPAITYSSGVTMREYSNYNAPSNMLVILSREDGEGPHPSPWITLVACVNSKA
jgi:hypothetical protein